MVTTDLLVTLKPRVLSWKGKRQEPGTMQDRVPQLSIQKRMKSQVRSKCKEGPLLGRQVELT